MVISTSEKIRILGVSSQTMQSNLALRKRKTDIFNILKMSKKCEKMVFFFIPYLLKSGKKIAKDWKNLERD